MDTEHKLLFLYCVLCVGGLLIIESVQIEDEGWILEILECYYVFYLIWDMGCLWFNS